MAGSRIKVKVPVSLLLANAVNARAKLISDNAEATLKAVAVADKWQGTVVAGLEKALEAARNGTLPHHGTQYRGNRYRPVLYVEVASEGPEEISPVNTDYIDRDIALLTACSDETLSVSTNDNFARYL